MLMSESNVQKKGVLGVRQCVSADVGQVHGYSTQSLNSTELANKKILEIMKRVRDIVLPSYVYQLCCHCLLCLPSLLLYCLPC